MTNAAPSVSRRPKSVRSSPRCAVDGTHQREVEQDRDPGRRQHTNEGGENRRDAVLHEERDDDRREHDDLAVGEVEDAAETVDERHADAEQAEGEAEHDPVENDGPHVRSRAGEAGAPLLVAPSSLRSCHTEVRASYLRVPVELLRRPAQPDPPVLEHVAAVGDRQRERHLLLGDQQRHSLVLEPFERLERRLSDDWARGRSSARRA